MFCSLSILGGVLNNINNSNVDYYVGVFIVVCLLGIILLLGYVGVLIRENKKLIKGIKDEQNILKTILSVIPYGLSVKNKDDLVVCCNEKYAYEFGIAEVTQLNGKRLDGIRMPVSCVWDNKFISDYNDVRLEGVIERYIDDSLNRWYKIHKFLLFDEISVPSGKIEIIEDVTESKQQNSRFEHNNELLNNLSIMLQEVVVSVNSSELHKIILSRILKVASAEGGLLWGVDHLQNDEYLFQLLNYQTGLVKIDKQSFSLKKSKEVKLLSYVDICNRVLTIARPISSIQLADNDPSGKFNSSFGVSSYLFIPVCTKKQEIIAVLCLFNYSIDNEEFLLEDLNPFVTLAGYTLDSSRTARMKLLSDSTLSQINRQMVSLMDNLPGTVFSCLNNNERSLVFISKGCETLTGYTSEKFKNQALGLQDLVLPEDKIMVWKKFQEAVLSNKSYQVNYRIIKSTGECRWVAELGKITTINNSGEYLIDGILMDITEQVERNLRLRESEDFNRSLLNAIPDRILRVDKTGTIISAPQQSVFFSAFESESEISGLNISALFGVENEDVVMFGVGCVLSTQKVKVIELSSGDTIEPYWVEVRIVPYQNEEVLLIIKDVTTDKLKEVQFEHTEYLLKTQFEHGNIAMGIMDEELKWNRVNQRFLLLVGYSEDELNQLTFEKLIVKEDADYVLSVFEQLKDGSRENFEIDQRLRSKEGLIIYSHINITPFRNNINKNNYFLISIQDITYRKELERKVLTSVIETEERERIRFAQELHDGLGPILSSIKMYVQWIQMPDIKTDPKNILKDTEDLVDEAHRTVKEISFNMSPHVLKNFGLLPALETFTAKISELNTIQFGYQVFGVKRRYAEDVEIILYRVLTECINNTIKYAKATEVLISLQQTDSLLTINCKDNGIGFNVEEVLQGRQGMGLFNMKNRLRSISGKLDISSSPGIGTDVTIVVNVN